MKTKSIKRVLTTVVIAAIIMYIALLVVLFSFQRDLIFPGQATQGIPSTQVTATSGEELVRLRADGTTVTGLFARAAAHGATHGSKGADCPTVIFFSGNGSCIAYSREIVEAMRRRNTNVLIVDYPGYGMSGGRPSDVGDYAAADSAYRYVANRPDCDPHLIVAAGWSLGSSVATHLAATRPVAGLAIWSAFTDMAEMSNRQYPIVPTPLIRVLLKYPFPTIREIARVNTPIFIAHGAVDSFVPISMPRRLAAATSGPVAWVSVTGARHNDIFAVGGEALMDRFGQWLAHLPRRPTQSNVALGSVHHT